MKKAAIIIVNWNGKNFLKNCLDSVFRQTYKNFEIYFVDNGSMDGSIEFVNKYFPKSKIINLDKNYGFAKGTNEGIREAFKDNQVQYIVCLNNDTIVDKNWLKELIKTAEKSKIIGMVSSKILLPNGKIQNVGMYLNDTMGAGSNLLKGHLESPDNFDSEIEIFSVCGAAFLVKKAVLTNIGLFDENFFAYAEDFDLSFRARLNGWKCLLSPNAIVTHLHSKTLGCVSEFKTFLIKRNSYLLVIKNFPTRKLIMFPLKDFIFTLNGINKKSSEKQFISNKNFFQLSVFVLKIYLSIIRLMPKYLIKRFENKKIINVTNSEINNWFLEFGD
jgi:GT2 family glycosyltransferase